MNTDLNAELFGAAETGLVGGLAGKGGAAMGDS